MRKFLLVTACVFVSGCLATQTQVTPQVAPVANAVNSDCYTVDFFNNSKVEKTAAWSTEYPEAVISQAA